MLYYNNNKINNNNNNNPIYRAPKSRKTSVALIAETNSQKF